MMSYVKQAGATNDYKQMLKNQNNYFISNGISKTVIDLNKNIIVNGGQGEINYEEYNKRN